MTTLPGYVTLASYDDRSDDSGHSAAWKALREAVLEGVVDGFQHGGSKRWLVNKEQADAFLAEKHRPEFAPEDSATNRVSSATFVKILETLERIAELLDERLDDKQPTGHWRDMNGEVLS